MEAAFGRNLGGNPFDGTFGGQVRRDVMACPSGILRRRDLGQPRDTATQHENVGAVSEEPEGNGAPDIARCAGNQCHRIVQVHGFRPDIVRIGSSSPAPTSASAAARIAGKENPARSAMSRNECSPSPRFTTPSNPIWSPPPVPSPPTPQQSPRLPT